jgi:hypothetical protein
MPKISEEERKKILASPPVGTWVLMVTVGVNATVNPQLFAAG